MERKAVAPPQLRGGGKVKNGPTQGRNRKALGDIGNMESLKIVGGKQPVQVSRRVTRRFHAQLLAKAKEEAEKKNQVEPALEDRVTIYVERRISKKVSGAQKNVSDNFKSVRITKEIPDESASGRKSRERSSMKSVKAFTSTLSARSKAACEITSKSKQHIENIDADDVNDELAVVEYIDDIYKFYKLAEDEIQLHDYMNAQPDINARMRSILVDWLAEVHCKFELMPETLYLTMNILDRYLSVEIVSRRELQLIGIGSMLVAGKYEEVWPPQVNDFVCLSDYSYTREQILVMEKSILRKMEWHLTVPTPYVFLVRFIKASVSPDKEMENMVFFLAELGVMNYPTTILYKPSMLAAAAVYAARCTLNKSPFWSKTLQHHTGYSEEQLIDCAKLLAGFHSSITESKLKAIYKKFSNPRRGAVALFSPAKSLQALNNIL